MAKLKIKVNGRVHAVAASPNTPLLYVLRNELRLNGPRFGCGLAQCGSCSVLLNNKEIRSCITPVAAVAKANVTTLEGLARLWKAQGGRTTTAVGRELHPVQQAWIDEQVPQCGYCQNGMMIRATELLQKREAADRGPDQVAHEHAPLPVRDVSADHEGDQAGLGDDGEGGVDDDGASERRDRSTPPSNVSSRARRSSRAAARSSSGSASPAACSRARLRAPAHASRPGRPTRPASTRGSRCTRTTPRRSTSGRSTSPARTPGLLQIAAEELDMSMAQVTGDRRRHRVLAEPGHHGRLERHLERRPAGPPGGGGGACRAPRARRQAARRARSRSSRSTRASCRSRATPRSRSRTARCSAASASRRRTPAGRR